MKFKPVQRVSLQDQIYERLLQAIQAGHYRPGEKLPSIPTLAAEFDVSISPTRLAIQKLDENGFVESRHGSGTYVLDPVERFNERDSACICVDYNAHLFSDVYMSLLHGFQNMGKFGFGLNVKEENFPVLLEKFLKSETKVFIYVGDQYFPYRYLKPELIKGKTFISIIRAVGPRLAELNASAVLVDLHAGTNKIVEFLKERGHRHILVAGSENMINASFGKYKTDRSEVLINRRKYRDLTFSKILGHDSRPSGQCFDEAVLMASLTGARPATAVLGLRDWEISEIQKVLIENDPALLKTLDLVGIGNTPYSQYSTFPFSTVDFNIEALTHHVCRLANMAFRQKTFKPETIYIEPKLVVRG